MSAPERLTRRKCVDTADLDGTLAEVRDEVAALITKHGETATVDIDTDDDGVLVRIYATRPETDREYADRCALLEREVQRERETLARLKAKYEGGS